MLSHFLSTFFSYPPSSGIAPCVGTVGTLHMTLTLDAALLYVVHRDGVTTNFGPIPWQAAEIIGGLLVTESQSDRCAKNRIILYYCVKVFNIKVFGGKHMV